MVFVGGPSKYAGPLISSVEDDRPLRSADQLCHIRRSKEAIKDCAGYSGKTEGVNRKIRGLLAGDFGFRDHDFLKLRL